ncbi:TPA_asm: hypothetical protein HUJ06_000087 [Nelumbo nucifera]|uniref:Transmembrane protein n=1 Tax=Nelumbo nucifera TaxID=4432 RepID=A0A823A560_NELNU|nr:TPA_asm: hypothetical protein HUJ06_000087 [Nelumbo nucifera]
MGFWVHYFQDMGCFPCFRFQLKKAAKRANSSRIEPSVTSNKQPDPPSQSGKYLFSFLLPTALIFICMIFSCLSPLNSPSNK